MYITIGLTFLIQIIGLLAYGSSSKLLKLNEWILNSGWSTYVLTIGFR